MTSRFATATIAAAMLLTLVPGLGLGAADAIAAEAPWTIRIGWVVTPGHMTPLVAALGKREPQMFKHLAKSYQLAPIRFNGTSPQIQAQAIGELEIASFSTSAFALAITNAHLDERLVADVVADGHPGYFSENFVVLADGPIHTVEDVKGRRVATNTIGSASDTAMRTMFRKHGLQNSDFTTVEANFANMPAMLDSGKVDLIGTLPQFVPELASKKYRVLFRASDAVGPTQAVVWAVRAEVIAAHRAALVDYFEDHIRAVRWFLDPKNREEALAILADVTKLPRQNLAFAFTKDDLYHSPDARPDVASVQREIDASAQMGVIPKRVAISPRYVDLSLIAEAKRRIDGN